MCLVLPLFHESFIILLASTFYIFPTLGGTSLQFHSLDEGASELLSRITLHYKKTDLVKSAH